MGGSKKAEQKRKEKVVEDKTFGLKNKNRSSKVQAYVQQVQKTVTQTNPNDKRALAEAEERRRIKEEKKAREAELALLFRTTEEEERKKRQQSQAANAGPETEEGAGEQFTYNPDDYLFRPEDFDEVERDDRRLEEKLEEEREALQGRSDLTPVTEESFQAWKKAKREEAEARETERVRKAKAGQGKLKGWDLWQMDRELFVDDVDADEAYEREERDEEEEEAYDLS